MLEGDTALWRSLSVSLVCDMNGDTGAVAVTRSAKFSDTLYMYSRVPILSSLKWFHFLVLLTHECDFSLLLPGTELWQSKATGCGLDNRGVAGRVPVGSIMSLPHVVWTDSGAHPASYIRGTGGSFPGSNAAGA
jgi:hypothetical protein